MTWNEEEKKKIVDNYWKNGIAYCPKDGSKLEIQEVPWIGRADFVLYVRCIRCQEVFNSDEVQTSQLVDEYSKDEIKKIVDVYFKARTAQCPRDHTYLTLHYAPFSMGEWVLLGRCPRCGRNFQRSSKEEK